MFPKKQNPGSGRNRGKEDSIVRKLSQKCKPRPGSARHVGFGSSRRPEMGLAHPLVIGQLAHGP